MIITSCFDTNFNNIYTIGNWSHILCLYNYKRTLHPLHVTAPTSFLKWKHETQCTVSFKCCRELIGMRGVHGTSFRPDVWRHPLNQQGRIARVDLNTRAQNMTGQDCQIGLHCGTVFIFVASLWTSQGTLPDVDTTLWWLYSYTVI